MKILITGICGFVGSHLAELYSTNSDCEIWGTALYEESHCNIEHIDKNRLNIIELDIRNYDDIIRILEEVKPDYIFHLAGQSSAGFSFKKPHLTYEINTLGTLNLLEAIRSLQLSSRVLFISTADIYGIIPSDILPVMESYQPQPINPYGVSKYTAELIAKNYSQVFDIPIIITRPFNHIGIRQRVGFVISDFSYQIARIIKGLQKPIIKIGNLNVKRDFTDVRDVVKAYSLLIEKGVSGEVYQICSGKSYSLEEILQTLIKLAKIDIKLEVDEKLLRPVDLPVLWGSYEKLNQLTNWQPNINIEETLNDILDYWIAKIES